MLGMKLIDAGNLNGKTIPLMIIYYIVRIYGNELAFTSIRKSL